MKNRTLGDVETSSGVWRGYLSRIEKYGRQKSALPLSVLVNLSMELGVPVDKLVTRKTEQERFEELAKTGAYSTIGVRKDDAGFVCYAKLKADEYKSEYFEDANDAMEYLAEVTKEVKIR
jgi:transcriptional regulator with XRE-family HTH domain